MAALTLTLVTAPTFGIVFSGASSRQFILNTDDSVTGTHGSDAISGATAGSLTVDDSGSPASINILADNISTLGGLTVNSVHCSYNGAAQTACDGSGINVTSGSSINLKVGLDVTTSSTHSGGDSASVSFDVTVSFL